MEGDVLLMFSISTRLHLKNILERIATGSEISLQERIYINKFADQNQSVAICLKKASRMQKNQNTTNEIDQLLNDLELGSSDPQSVFKPKVDDLGEWFSGAPSWLARS